jgi:hypothetical protein
MHLDGGLKEAGARETSGGGWLAALLTRAGWCWR